ncbi:MAG: glycosyltransferase family A protein [Armatimonadetes bacterium]|nr:glycosyltransferase family A protein [Armatimonadota bacterium]
MREGVNPGMASGPLGLTLNHRVIIPIYIPETAGYFSRALEVLELCLASLRKTAQGRAAVSLVINGACPECRALVEREVGRGWIDRTVFNSVNVGRVNAMVAEARSAHEPLITLADADALFREGWLQAVERLFAAFPECGFAAPLPHPVMYRRHALSTLFGAWTGRLLSEAKVVDEADLDRFARSTANPDCFGPVDRASQVIVRRNGYTACVGAGHFVCTLRYEAVRGLPPIPTPRIMGPPANERLDLPPDMAGFWRLSTTMAHVDHMGNVPEPWMQELVERLREPDAAPNADAAITPYRQPLASALDWSIRRRAGDLLGRWLARRRRLRAARGEGGS